MKLLTQYLWRDEPRGLAGSYSGWQSGLRFADGRAKPSLKTFATPFVLDASRSRLWGQVRSRETRTVTVQRRLRGKLEVARRRDAQDRRPRLLELVHAPGQGRLLSLPRRRSDERLSHPQVESRAVSRVPVDPPDHPRACERSSSPVTSSAR